MLFETDHHFGLSDEPECSECTQTEKIKVKISPTHIYLFKQKNAWESKAVFFT